MLIAGSLLGLATISDAFVYIVLQQGLALTAMAFPLLYVGTSLFNSVFSVPCGAWPTGTAAVWYCSPGTLCSASCIS